MPSLFFRTSTYAAPRYEVTVRDSLDGWGIDYHGEYTQGGWEFDLTDPKYAAGFAFKFYLAEAGWMNGANLQVAANSADITYEEAQVTFASTPIKSGVVTLPAVATLILSLIAGVLSVLNQTTFGFPAPWGTSLTIALLFLSSIGISPLTGANFRNALHLPASVIMVVSAAIAAGGTAALNISDSTTRAVVIGILTVLAGLGFGPVPALA